jgi:two-component system, LytTR family, sensor kinase
MSSLAPPSAFAVMTPRRTALLYTLCWVPLAALFAVAIGLQSGGALSWHRAALAGALNVVVPWSLGFGIWRLSERMTLPAASVWRFTAVHSVCAICFASLWASVVLMDLSSNAGGFVERAIVMRTVIPWQWLSGVFVYIMIAGVSYTIRNLRRSRELQAAADRANYLRVQAELHALRAQINPHFLFNALHAVTQLLHTDPAQAEHALERLSTLFRYALRLDREQIELVTIEEEWRFSQDYLWLEQLRLGDRLNITAAMDDDALDCLVPPFSLQPLLENAVKHGIAPRIGTGRITITVSEALGRVTLCVADDGVGSTELAAVASRGVGLRAVTQRIESQFGEGATHRIVTAPDQGFRIELEFPAHRAQR